MGNSKTKGHDEYNRESIKCRGYVEKYSFKRGVAKRRFFTLKDSSLSYSKTKEEPVTSMQPLHTVKIDKSFKILYDDLDRREISIECTNKRGENALWKLIFTNKENTEKWAHKLKKAVRPVWEDPNATVCSVCAKNFQLFRRQHHCRNCGRVICAAHCKLVPSLPELGYSGKVKVCSNCVNRLGNVNGVERARSLGEREAERKTGVQYNSVMMRPGGSILE
jgi:hypothetical protein